MRTIPVQSPTRWAYPATSEALHNGDVPSLLLHKLVRISHSVDRIRLFKAPVNAHELHDKIILLENLYRGVSSLAPLDTFQNQRCAMYTLIIYPLVLEGGVHASACPSGMLHRVSTGKWTCGHWFYRHRIEAQFSSWVILLVYPLSDRIRS